MDKSDKKQTEAAAVSKENVLNFSDEDVENAAGGSGDECWMPDEGGGFACTHNNNPSTSKWINSLA